MSKIVVKDGWVESSPEKFEERLFVMEDTYNSGLFEGCTRGHIAVYPDDPMVEYCHKGEYTFIKPENEADLKQTVELLMEEGE